MASVCGMKAKQKRMLASCVVASGLMWLTGCGGGHGEAAGTRTELAPRAVTTVAVVERESERLQPLPGTVYPADQAVLSSRILAAVARADFLIGQRVAAGEVLVALEADEIAAQVEQARATLAQLERNYQRETGLLAQGATTAESVRTLEDQMRVARARLSEANTMAGYTEVRAPYDGIITAKEVLRGDLVAPGTPLLTIEGLDAMEIHVMVPDSLAGLELGTGVKVQADSEVLGAQLTEWSPAADPASRTRLAKLTVPAGQMVRSGQYVRVYWPAETTAGLWIPAEALRTFGQMEQVFIVQDGVARLQLVKSGRSRDGWVQIRSGLDGNERLVAPIPATLVDGQPLTLN